jgi:hypothetical protein
VEALAGAVVGAVVSGIAALVGYWLKSRRDLRAAAQRCYDRLLKVKEATNLPAQERGEAVENEIHLLGGHMDLFVASMGSLLRAKTRERYWRVYETMIPILIRHDLTNLEGATNALRPLTGRPSK